MILWRVSNYQSMDGVGGLYVSERWHTKGHPVVYCTLNSATALLETLVHIGIDSEDRPEHF
jgi:RES domain-containing protein